MSDWDATWKEMRMQFLKRATERLGKLALLIDSLGQKRTDAALVAQLHREWHWLIGVGGTYQLKELTGFGEQGEQICDRYMDGGAALADDDLTRLKDLLKQAAGLVSSAQESA